MLRLEVWILHSVLRMRRFWNNLKNLNIEEERAEFENAAKTFTMPQNIAVEEIMVEDMPAEWVQEEGENPKVHILYLHGGGYTMGSISTHRALAGRIAKAAKSRVLLPEYRLAPENPFPCAVDDAALAYRFLMKAGIPASQIVIAGDSAGGGLTLATLLYLKNQGEELPAAAVCLSPWTDLLGTGESLTTKAHLDPMLDGRTIPTKAKDYLQGADPKNPLASPLYGDFCHCPPLLIQVGTEEVLLDDARRIAEKAKEAGVDVTLEVWDRMPHVWHYFAHLLPQGQEAIQKIGKFIQEKCGKPSA